MGENARLLPFTCTFFTINHSSNTNRSVGIEITARFLNPRFANPTYYEFYVYLHSLLLRSLTYDGKILSLATLDSQIHICLCKHINMAYLCCKSIPSDPTHYPFTPRPKEYPRNLLMLILQRFLLN